MKLLFAASECAPFCKTGGLADVAGSLPEALARAGVEVAVVMPLYDAVGAEWREKMKTELVTEIRLSWRRQYCGLLSLERGGVKYYFIDNEYYFKRGRLYGEYDDGERFAFFCRAVTKLFAGKFDVFHCNDWQTALIPLYLRDMCCTARTVFTIHNIEYQGKFDRSFIGDVLGLGSWWAGTLELDGCVNLMKAAVETADAVTTVSRTYAREIQTPSAAHGLDPVMLRNSAKLTGIVNGIDVVPVDITQKSVLKAALRKRLSLDADTDAAIISIVSRLVYHKGCGLILDAFEEIMNENVQFVLLGTGDTQYENAFKAAAEKYKGRASVNITYNNELASAIYAASDLYLMPSINEPCGLSQLIAMKNGAVPIVRRTGGLEDTVPAFDPETGTGRGFTFLDPTPAELARAVRRAMEQRALWPQLAARNLAADFSWKAPADEYLKIYGG